MTEKKKDNLFASLANLKAREAVAVASPPELADGDAPSPAPARSAVTPSRRTAEKKPATVGKRNDPDYCQFNTYIPKKLRRAVERALLDKDGMDNSSLVESLLTKWLKSQGGAE